MNFRNWLKNWNRPATMNHKRRHVSRLGLVSLEDRVTPVNLEAITLADPSLLGATSPGSSSTTSFSTSADGRYVAFQSDNANLVPGDSNGATDIFVRDLLLGTTTRVSVADNEDQGNSASYSPSISADGTKVAFTSYATNLVGSSDTNGTADVFVRNLTAGTTTRVSVADNEDQGNSSSYAPSISADGIKVAFYSYASNLVGSSDTNESYDVFVRDLTAGTTTRVSVADNGDQGNNTSSSPSMSADGNKVAFQSFASNLVGSSDTNGQTDIFVRDLVAGTTTRVSVGVSGIQGNSWSYNSSISADGAKVAFESTASNLVGSSDTNNASDVFVRDLTAGTTTWVSVGVGGIQGNSSSYSPSISAEGTKIAFTSYASNLVGSSDTNDNGDVFVRDLTAQTTTLVSVADNGDQGNSESAAPSISADGTRVAFQSYASNLVGSSDTNNAYDVFVRDLTAQTTTLASGRGAGLRPFGNDYSENSSSGMHSVSADGRFVAFTSYASNLVPDDTNGYQDVFVYDRLLDVMTRVSVADNEDQSNGYSYNPSISADGTKIAFFSYASNLVGSSDTNGTADVFVRDLLLGTTTRVSVADNEDQGNSSSYAPSISADGIKVAFYSYASNLVGSSDTNRTADVFVRDLTAGTTTRVSVADNGDQGNNTSSSPSMSADGNKVAFQSFASNLVGSSDTNRTADVFVRDLTAGTTTRVSVADNEDQGNSESSAPSISADGTRVAFLSYASNLVYNDYDIGYEDVFLRDLVAGTTTLVSVDSEILSYYGSYPPSISADGTKVAFTSTDFSNLVGTRDTNGYLDVFVWDLVAGTTTLVSVGEGGIQGNADSYAPSISGNGLVVTFQSNSGNWFVGDGNQTSDIFAAILTTPPTALSIALTNPSPTNAATVSWTVTFDQLVGGVSSSNFTLVNTGLGGTPAITTVTAVSPDINNRSTIWTVTASTGSGEGTLGLDLTTNTGITNADGATLEGAAITGPAYTIDKVLPVLLSLKPVLPNGNVINVNLLTMPANSKLPWQIAGFIATYSEAVTGVTGAALTGGLAGTYVSGNGTAVIRFSVPTITSGSFSVGMASVNDLVGNGSAVTAIKLFSTKFGDVSGDGRVTQGDLTLIRNNYAAFSSGGYLAQYDLDGDGDVDVADYNLARGRLNT